jgi:hypothetical protein
LPKPSKRDAARSTQLEEATKILGQLQADLKALRQKRRSCSDLSNHLTGFYDEINKLAKGRAIIEATHLVVEQANDIIRDAKQIVESDVHLDRVKEFVPAGNNPVYSDVLVVARSVRQSLDRCKKEFDRKEIRLLKTTTRATTVIGAVECFLNEDEENGESGVKEDVERYVVGAVADSCFYEDGDSREECFDFDDLDSQSVEDYIRKTGDDEVGEDGAIGVEDQEGEPKETDVE